MIKEAHELTIGQRIALLSKPTWSYRDIGLYFGYSATKAIEIKKQARQESGNLPKFDSSKATVMSILNLCGSTLENEIYKVKMLSEAENGQQ